MCGIAGIVHEDRERPVADRSLAAMLQELRYRGPDAAGSHFDRGVALGHRRLAVIDLQGGRQPMTDPSQRFTLSFNGEIYNFAEVRESLEATGVRFATRSDTEVILLGYRAWGPAVLDRLVGMFALAIWDREHETLFLARDRLGVKPLYWARVPRVGFVFASELSAVLASEMIRRRLDPEALGTYLANGYVVGESSLIAGVHRLPAGHTLCWRRGGEPQCRRYWDIGEAWRRAVSTPVRDPSAALEGFAERLRTAVRQRLVSDVPLGAFLSGGLDSSTIVALMKEQQAEVRTFSIGFREASYDELPWARRVAQHLGTRHSETVVSASAPELLEELSAKLDEPFADTSIVPTYALCRESRRQVTVALSGDGADELLAGYVTHIATDLQRKLHRVPGWARRLTRAAVARVPDSRRKVSWTFRLKQFARGLGEETWAAHAGWRVIGTPAVVASLLQGQVQRPSRRPIAEFERAYREVPDLPELDRLLIGDYRTWLVDDILCKVDRASAGCGLEVRSPFLDHRLVEYCAGLPPGLKLQGRRGKIVLRHFAAQHLPPEILQRKKAGFNAPVSHWLATSWRLIAEDVFAAHRLGSTGVLEPRAVRTLWEEHTAGRRDHGYLLFALLMLGLWLDRFRPSL